MKLTVIGTGYVGLVTGACFSDTGNEVICMDSDRRKIERLSSGEVPIFEPGLEDLIKRNVAEGRLAFTTDLEHAVRSSEVLFIAVGTPPDEDGSADLSHVLGCSRDIAGLMNAFKVVVVKSTVPVGTCDKVEEVFKKVLAERGVDFTAEVVSNPEFLKQGSAVKDFMSPDRVVIGMDGRGRASELMEELYAPFSRTSHRVMNVDRRSSEVIKYASNAMLALRISFMNEISELCESAGADIETVRYGMGADKRIGPSFLYSGVGYGGSCFPKDVKALKNTCKEFGCSSEMLAAVDSVNERQKRWPLRVLERHWNGGFEGRKIALWGIAYKPNTDDIREAPSVVIVRGLLEKGAKVVAHDPAAVENFKKIIASDRLTFSEHPYDALSGADAVVLVTEWGSYRTPDFSKMKALMREPVILDGRNQYNPAALRELGFVYYGVGRGRALH